MRRSFSFGGRTHDLEEPAAEETKLFSSRRSPAPENRSQDNDVGASKRFSLRRTRSSAEQVFGGHRVPAPPRPDAPTMGVVGLAAHNIVSKGLSMFKGLTSTGGESDRLRYGIAHTVGRRPYMEDRFVANCELNSTDSVFGVFDGHGGELASQYCADNIPVQLRLNKRLANDPEMALVQTFERVDKTFCQMARHQMLDDGTTAVVALVRGNTVWCANAGDSRCIMSRKAIAVPLSHDHKPNRADERKRIMALGGFVKHLGVWRTQGVLAVSRAIGDLSLKKYVIPTPDVIRVDLDETDEFLVLASDGLWDVLENQDVVDLLHTRPALLIKPEQAARALVAEAFRRGSDDNIAVVVVVLNPLEEVEEKKPSKEKRGKSKKKKRSGGLDSVEES